MSCPSEKNFPDQTEHLTKKTNKKNRSNW